MKSVPRLFFNSIAIFLTLGISCQCLLASPVPILSHKEVYVVQSGTHEGIGTEMLLVFNQTIKINGVPWIQLHFSDYNLGSNSYMLITSVLDGVQQTMDAQSLEQWADNSAYFNGDTVVLELYAAPGDSSIFFQIEEISVGDPHLPGPEPQEICGSTDDRISSSDPAVGRIMPSGCTGWLISNGAGLTAGHCVGTGHSIQFNVPSSTANGTTVNPPPEDQYPITYTDSSNTGIGDDWAVFSIAANHNGDTVVQRQNDFFRMSIDLNPITVRETGYGIDGPAPLFGDGERNADSQTQQTHAGPFVDETVFSSTVVRIRFQIDDENGNSGSPVMDTANGVTIGIATSAGCTASGGSNNGTGFENNNLENAIQSFAGSNVEYVDSGHPITTENGTVFRPWNTVQEAVDAASSNARLNIVKGSYPGSVLADKPLTLSAPVGSVILGQ